MADEVFEKRIKELKSRSENRGIFTYSDFLSPTKQEVVCRLFRDSFELYGGADFCERKIVRFGNLNEIAYEEPFPIAVIEISLRGEKFSRELTHRDFLGAITSLGIERDKIGDIFSDGKKAYVCLSETLSEYVIQNLQSVGRVPVDVRFANCVPSGYMPKREEKIINVASVRLDAVIARVCCVSREKVQDFFKEGRVSVCGKAIEKSFYELKPGDVISVKGFGKFVLKKTEGVSSKGRQFVFVEVFK